MRLKKSLKDFLSILGIETSANPYVNYQLAHKKISVVHAFRFGLRKNFTPYQKSAITKAARKYSKLAQAVSKKYFSVIPFSKTKKLRYFKSQFHKSLSHTNKGYIFPRGHYRVKLNSKTKKYAIHSSFDKRKDIFIPLPTHLYNEPEKASEWISMQFSQRKKYGHGATMSVSIKGKKSMSAYLQDDSEAYLPQIIGSLQSTSDSKNPINGVYFTYFSNEMLEREPATKKPKTKKPNRKIDCSLKKKPKPNRKVDCSLKPKPKPKPNRKIDCSLKPKKPNRKIGC